MDRIAEYGIAAHALYKDGRGSDTDPRWRARAGPIDGCAAPWRLLAEGDSPEEFLEHTKLELFHDQVFCFTPKGRLIALPRGATPIDFAYAVHTDVGNTAVGCKVNGRIVPLLSELHNGDEVEIARGARTGAAGRLGDASSSPARRGPPSAAPRGPPCASNMPGSGARSSSAPSSAARSHIPRKSCGRAAAPGAIIAGRRAGGRRPRRDVLAATS